LLLGIWVPALSAGPLEDALETELDRSLDRLALEGLARPYHIAYYVYLEDGFSASASLGAILDEGPATTRLGHVVLRVGSPEMDNSNYYGGPTRGGFRIGTTTLPLETGFEAVRRAFWLATDEAYKQAVEVLAQKDAALKSRTREPLPDFTDAPPTRHRDDPVELDLTPAELTELTRRLSAVLADYPALQRSEVEVEARILTTVMRNSEGSAFTKHEPRVTVSVLAATQAEDGRELRDALVFRARSRKDLPSDRELRDRVAGLGASLTALRTAPVLDRYNGPVWFTAEAAAQLFARSLAPAVANHRRPLMESDRFDPFSGPDVAPFQDRLGGRVLPRPVTLVDDPTRQEIDDEPLLGHYAVDDEGVEASATQVIRRGRLRALLATRNPSAEAPESTGNARGGFAMPSNLILDPGEPLSDRDLEKEFQLLLEEAELEYGIVVRALEEDLYFEGERPSFDRPLRFTRVVKRYRDGREEPLRKVEASGFSAAAFRDLIGMGRDRAVYHSTLRARALPFGRLPSVGGPRLFSVAVPAMLFEELSLRKPEGETPTLPAYGPPGR